LIFNATIWGYENKWQQREKYEITLKD